MRQITYEYDETNPTNKDYLIAALADAIDDGGASYESVAEYDIDCPYMNTTDCLNEREKNEYGTAKYTECCIRCKLAWLQRPYNTYPSDDGIWEVTE